MGASARLRHVVDGVIWSGVQSVLSRGVRLGSQLLLAYLLAPADFGLFAMATAVSAIILQFQDIGLGQVLLQRRERARFWERPVLVLSLALGLATAALMVLIAPFAAAAYGKEQVQGLLFVLALAAPFQALTVLPMRRLQRTLRFRRLALLQTVSAVLTMALTCLLAYLDYAGLVALGPYCFVIPTPVSAVLMLVLYARSARLRFALPARRDLRVARWVPLIRRGAMVFTAGWLGSLVAQGDYAVLGLFFDETVVGLYFMAFTLSNQGITLFAAVFRNVLAPSLYKIGSDPKRQVENTLTMMRALALVGLPLAVGQAVVADPLVRLLLPEKWHTIGPMVSLLSIAISFRLISLPAWALWLAQGRYRGNLILVIAVVIAFAPVIVGTAFFARQAELSDPALAMAGAVGCFFVAEAAITTIIRFRVQGVSSGRLAALIGTPLAASITAGVAGWIMGGVMPDDLHPAMDVLARGAVFVLVAMALSWPAFRALQIRSGISFRGAVPWQRRRNARTI
jgi:O-antigen/teichoic acid export membrane protein